MPYGFFTIEQFKPKTPNAKPTRGKPQWLPVAHIDAHKSLTDAINLIAQRNRPGFFRVVQMQRVIWAEKKNGKLKLRKWHAGSPKSLARGAKAFIRDKGKYPI